VTVPGTGRHRSDGSPEVDLLHDDAERELAYRSEAVSSGSAEPVTEAATRLGWTTVSMRDDWATIFPEA